MKGILHTTAGSDNRPAGFVPMKNSDGTNESYRMIFKKRLWRNLAYPGVHTAGRRGLLPEGPFGTRSGVGGAPSGAAVSPARGGKRSQPSSPYPKMFGFKGKSCRNL